MSEPWFILGAGALGSALSTWMRAQDIPVTLLGRGASEDRRVIEGDHETRIPTQSLAALAPGSIRRLLVTTKAGQIAEAVRAALPFLAPGAIAVTTANGLGYTQEYAQDCAQRPGTLHLHRAVSTAAAFRDEAGVVHIAARGSTRVGTGARDPAPWFVDSLARLPGWRWEPAIEEAAAAKFAVNCVINPLTALHRCRNGELLDGDRAGGELATLCAETEPALRALGLWRGDTALVDVATAVCAQTARNRSSMLQDVLAGRPTELPFLTGELLRRCAQAGIDVPANRALHQRLQAVAPA